MKASREVFFLYIFSSNLSVFSLFASNVLAHFSFMPIKSHFGDKPKVLHLCMHLDGLCCVCEYTHISYEFDCVCVSEFGVGPVRTMLEL